MAKKTDNQVIQVSPELQKNLNAIEAFKSEAVQIAEMCKQIIVNDESTLAIAQQNLSKATSLVNSIEKHRKEIKQPYLDATKQIDGLAGEISSPLEEAINHIKAQVKNWEIERIKRAEKEKAEAEAKLREEQAAAEKKKAENERILNFLNKTMPEWFKTEFAKLKTAKECDALVAYINTKLYSEDKMGEYVSQYREMKENYVGIIELKKQQFISAEFMSDEEKLIIKQKEELAAQKEALAAREREIAAEEERIKQEKIAKELAAKAEEERNRLAAEEAANKTTKTRRVWKFELVDKSKLSPEWTTIDEAAVKAYMSENKDSLKDGQIINGVKFVLDITVVS